MQATAETADFLRSRPDEDALWSGDGKRRINKTIASNRGKYLRISKAFLHSSHDFGCQQVW
jgi:hypothetical protein